MTIRKAKDYMEDEIRCIQRASYCDRDCAKCNLVKEEEPLLEAFGMAIKALEEIEEYRLKEFQCHLAQQEGITIGYNKAIDEFKDNIKAELNRFGVVNLDTCVLYDLMDRKAERLKAGGIDG